MQPAELHVIYALTEPGDDEDIRYIGATINPTNRRHSHTHIGTGNSPRDRWVADLKRRKLHYGFRILASVLGSWQKRDAAEREVIAQYAKERPDRLLNIIDRRERTYGQPDRHNRRRAIVAREEFERIARWAIRKCIMDGSLEKPEYKHGWWRHMKPAKYREQHQRRDKLAALKLNGYSLRSA